MGDPSTWKFLVLGVVFHFVYAFSIFDIHFRSPVVGGMAAVRAEVPPPG